ncbi:hypothetical protein BF38_5527 (plasmid) [Bacillus thuringiensis]|uniref:Uncharacterized protein n=1 Tax=Bacillus thuringiensis TaxID=1428 RepID=A0AB33B5X8_BACTU|nr:hypothetical protein BF38_5527 [Bacillus thuringiensis]
MFVRERKQKHYTNWYNAFVWVKNLVGFVIWLSRTGEKRD